MRPTGKKLITPQTRLGILDLEFAYDNYHTSKVLSAWQAEERTQAAKENTYIDFGLLFFYSAFIFYCCKNLAENFTGRFRKYGLLLAKGAIIAGLLDIFENTGMLISLSGNPSALLSLITATCALVKWLLAISGALYLIFAAPVSFYLIIKNKRSAAL